METRKLEVLLEAVEIGSLSKAAEKLGYSQSALVHMMNSLEEEIGLSLLSRNYSGVGFTPAGKSLETTIRALVELSDTFQDQIREIKERASKRVRIATIPSIATHWLPDVITQMLAGRPDLEIEMSVNGLEVSDIVERGEADIGFTEESFAGNNEWLPLMKDRFYAAVPASWNYPSDREISLEDLSSQNVLIPAGNQKNSAALALKKLAPKQMCVTAYGGSVLLAMVDRGLGVTILSGLYQSICPSTVQMIPTIPEFSRTLGLVARSFHALTPAQTAFVDYVKEKKFDVYSRS